MSKDIIISFPEASLARGNQFAMSLASAIRRTDPRVTVDIAKNNPNTQDLGSIVLLIVSSTAATAIASGIAAWISKQGNPTIELKRQDGTSMTITRAERHTAEIIRAALTDQK